MSIARRIAALAMASALALCPASAGTAAAVTDRAMDDAYPVSGDPAFLEDHVLTVAAPGVLDNDTVSSGTPCVAGSNSTGLAGSLGSGVADDGSFTFTPTANANGDTSFDYTLGTVNGSACVTTGQAATVTITISGVNDAPTISAKNDCADGSVTVGENSGAYPSSQACVHFDSAGPSNESSQTYTWVILGTSSTVGFSSGPSFSPAGNDGFLQFTPTAGQTGDATVSVQAKDSGGTDYGGADLSNVIDIHIHVVDNPPIANADSFIVLKNTTLNVAAPGVLHNDSDPDGDSITAVKVTNPTHGVVILAADGSFSYTPSIGYEGLDAFSYKASDGNLFSATRVVTLTVTAIPPVPTPTPSPTAVPLPTPTAEVPVTDPPTLAPGETATPEPPATPTPAPTVAGASAGPTPTAAPATTGDSSGGPSLPVLLVIVLFVLLVAFGAAVYVPKWLKTQSGR